MKEFESIRKDIQNRKLSPIYFLYGEEPYFIDELTNNLQKYVLTEDEKAFNEHIFYGNEIALGDVLLQAKQFPMMSDYQLVVVKEAQHYQKQLDQLLSYVEQPSPSTILVFNYKYGKPDGRLKVMTLLKKNFLSVESAKIRDYETPKYIEKLAKSLGFGIDQKSVQMLAEFLGEDLSKIHNEMEKLAILIKKGDQITPELIERNIGISKDYNVFELTKALSEKQVKKAFDIIHYFGQNPKNNSIFATLAVLFNFFSKILVYHTLENKTASSVASELKVSTYFVKEYQAAAHVFPLKKVTQIISYLRETDIKAKGVGVTGNLTEEDLMRELIYKIFRL